MKGQVFITTSILIVIALILLSSSYTKTITQENYLQNYFVNLKTELINTVDNAYLNGDDVATKLDSFILFSNNILSEKGYTEEITYTINVNVIDINLYLGKGEEYYKDKITIDRVVYT